MVLFGYYWFIELQFNQYKILLSLRLFIHQVFFFGFSKISFKIFVQAFFCWFLLVCIIFIGSAFIDPETCPQLWLQIFSGLYPSQTYGFASSVGLWKVVSRVPVIVIGPVSINTLIFFKVVPQVIQFCSCVGKCWLKGNQGPLG